MEQRLGRIYCEGGPMSKQQIPEPGVDVYGNKSWFLNGKLHRVDGPAVECVNGTKQWFLNGKYHRVDGPAIEWADGLKWWYLNGKRHRVWSGLLFLFTRHRSYLACGRGPGIWDSRQQRRHRFKRNGAIWRGERVRAGSWRLKIWSG